MATKRTGRIYMITNMITNEKYIGSTLQSIHKRWYKHKCNCNYGTNNYPIYINMRMYGIQNFRIELIHEATISNRQELLRIEGEFIRKFDTFKNGLNGCIAGRTPNEWENANRERRKQYKLNWHKLNPDKSKKSKIDWKKNNIDKSNYNNKLYSLKKSLCPQNY